MFKKSMAPRFTAREWSAAGGMHFYRGDKNRTLLVEIVTAEDVDGKILQRAVDRALERLPYYTWTFVRKKGLYYYAEDPLPMLVAESKEPRVIGGETTNYHMIDVTYDGPLMRFAMNHALCDGLGLNRFIEAVLYHYYCLTDGKQYSGEGIYTDKIPFSDEELVDVFANPPEVNTKDLKNIVTKEKRYRIPELNEEGGQGPLMYRLPLKIKTQDLLSWCKSASSSPAAAVTAIMMKAIDKENNVQEGLIMGIIACSLRKKLGAEKTFKNCALGVFVPATPEDVKVLSTSELAAKVRQTMKDEMAGDSLPLMVAAIGKLLSLGRKMPTYGLKQKVMNITKNPQDTFAVDYVGSLNTGDYSSHIVDVSYLMPDGFNGSSNIMISETAGNFHVSFAQTFKSDRYYVAFCDTLDELGIPYKKLPYSTYLNPMVIAPAEQK